MRQMEIMLNLVLDPQGETAQFWCIVEAAIEIPRNLQSGPTCRMLIRCMLHVKLSEGNKKSKLRKGGGADCSCSSATTNNWEGLCLMVKTDEILKAKRLITRLRLVDMLMKMDPDNRPFCNKSLKKRGGGLVGVSHGSARGPERYSKTCFWRIYCIWIIHHYMYHVSI